ncbi:MAG TPA: sulfatase [Planctomycetaceae bacterium]|nr:sulfatase [Planctomycetaceae bacterium]
MTCIPPTLLAGLLAVLPGTALADGPNGPDPRRNVVLFVVDDQGFQAGCYGDRLAKTPHLDRLAAEGTRFTRAHCTTASCSASRSVLLTGLQNHAIGHYGHSHGYNHFSTYESVPTLPVMLAEAGYRTCSIGKYHVAPEYVYHFETYANQGIQGARNSVRMAQNAKAWIAQDDDRPFFLYFCTSDPHRGGGPGGFANHNDNPEFYPGVTPVRFQPDEIDVPSWLPDLPEVRRELAEFYQAVSRADQGLGVLLDALEATGHADDTLVIFLSDNGPPFPGAKTNLYQPGMNLPLIVRQPGQERRGIGNDALVSWADITPTILDFCGVTPRPAPPIRTTENVGQRTTDGPKRPVEFHGRSFLSIIEDEHPDGWDESYASHTFHEITMYYPMRSITSGRHKYIFNIAHPLPYPFASDLYASPTWQAVLGQRLDVYGKRAVYAYLQRDRHELYDLEADPDELHNLANDPRHREKLIELQGKLRDWQKRTADPWVLKWEYE